MWARHSTNSQLCSASRWVRNREKEQRNITVHTAIDGQVFIVTIDRPEEQNAVDRPTAEALVKAFREFEANDELSVAVLTGAGGVFGAGADLKSFTTERSNRVAPDGDRPMGPTRMQCTKSVPAAGRSA